MRTDPSFYFGSATMSKSCTYVTSLDELVRKCESTKLPVHLLRRLPLLLLMETILLAGKFGHRQVQILTQPEEKQIIFVL
jgi:hypothetical protein